MRAVGVGPGTAAHRLRAALHPGHDTSQTDRRHPMTPAPVIRLHPDDGVLIARSSLPPGMVVADGVTTVGADPGGPQGRHQADRGGRTGTPLRPDHRLCHRADCAGPARAHAKLRHGRFRPGLCLWRRRQAGAELRSARDLRGHPPRRRAGGDAQLYRHHHLGELQRPCRRHRRRHVQEESIYRR